MSEYLKRIWAKQPAAVVTVFTTLVDALVVAYVADAELRTSIVAVITALAGLFLHTQVTGATKNRGKIDLRV